MGGIANPLTRKLAQLAPLTADDAAVLDALQSPTRTILRNRELIGAGRRYGRARPDHRKPLQGKRCWTSS